MGGPKKPTLAVFAQSLSDPSVWKRVGSAWVNTNRKGVQYTRIALDFIPSTNILTIWPETELETASPAEDETP